MIQPTMTPETDTALSKEMVLYRVIQVLDKPPQQRIPTIPVADVA